MVRKPRLYGEGLDVASGLARVGLRSGPHKSWERFALQRGASPLTTTGPVSARGNPVLYAHSGTRIALSIHLPEYRNIRYPPTQSRPHKKVRTRPGGTLSHGLIKKCVF